MSNDDEARYVVGIDLGTTNSALTYVDAAVPEAEQKVEVFDIPQLTAPGEVRSLPVLPSAGSIFRNSHRRNV